MTNAMSHMLWHEEPLCMAHKEADAPDNCYLKSEIHWNVNLSQILVVVSPAPRHLEAGNG